MADNEDDGEIYCGAPVDEEIDHFVQVYNNIFIKSYEKIENC